MARPKSKIERASATALLKTIGSIAGACPDWAVDPLGRQLGNLIWRVSRRYRQVAVRNLTFVYADSKTTEEIEALAKRVFQHFGKVGVEFFWLGRKRPVQIRNMVYMPDADVLKPVYEQGNGAIVITAHFGNWELLGRRLVADGHSLHVIARDSDDPSQAGYVNGIRERGGLKVIRRGDPASRMLEVLKQNELLGILPDQNTIDSPIFVPFFGKLASNAPGVALLSIRARCPVICGFAVRKEKGWEVETYPVIQPPSEGNVRDNIQKITERYTGYIEQQIRKYPEQWLWFHDRWKKRPPDETENV